MNEICRCCENRLRKLANECDPHCLAMKVIGKVFDICITGSFHGAIGTGFMLLWGNYSAGENWRLYIPYGFYENVNGIDLQYGLVA